MHQIFRFDFATVLHDGAVFFHFDMVMFSNAYHFPDGLWNCFALNVFFSFD
jgi:hypothetical protein